MSAEAWQKFWYTDEHANTDLECRPWSEDEWHMEEIEELARRAEVARQTKQIQTTLRAQTIQEESIARCLQQKVLEMERKSRRPSTRSQSVKIKDK